MRDVAARLVCVALSLGMLSAIPTPSASATASAEHQARAEKDRGRLGGAARVAPRAEFTLNGTFKTRPSSKVLLQRRTSDGAWRQIGKSVSRNDGHFTFDVTASSREGVSTFRATAPRPGRSTLRTNSWKVEVVVPGKWLQVTPGVAYSCGVKEDHTAWCWGRNAWGQLGIGTNTDVRRPHQLPGRWQSVTPSDYRTTCGIRLDGSGWCWGWYPGNGQASVNRPVKLDGTWRSLTPTSFTDFSYGLIIYTCGIRTDDTLWCWGRNDEGELGVGETEPHVAVLTPQQVPGSWREVSRANSRAQCGIQTDGSGWCWGGNDQGQLGNGTTATSWSPVQVPGTWTSLSSTLFGHTCGIQLDATAWCWGANSSGQVGDGTEKSRLTPYRLPGTWRSLDADWPTVCGVQEDASGWCWGFNMYGQVGDGTTEDRVTPYRLPGSWQSLLAQSTTCGVQVDGSGWCWGYNEMGGVGDGTTMERLRPRRLDGLWTSIEPRLVSCGQRPSGAWWCWGANYYGGVGNGSFGNVLAPSRLPGDWSEVTGVDTRCGIRPDHTAACWGRNDHGQAGVNTRGLGVSVPTVMP